MVFFLKGGLRGGNKECRALIGKLHCPYCYGLNVKYDSQVGRFATRWRCKDYDKKPELHEGTPYFVYDRSPYRDRGFNGMQLRRK